MIGGDPCPPLYIRGDSLSRDSWSPTTTRSGSFLCTAASPTPIRVVTREVRSIHELSLTLEYSMPVTSPAAPGLTSPRALRSRVLQAKYMAGRLRVLRVVRTSFWLLLILPSDTSSSPSNTFVCFEAVRCSSPEILIIYGARSTRALYGVAPEP